MKRALAALFVGAGLACASPFPTALPDLTRASSGRPESVPRRAYHPDRRDYIAFRAAHDEIMDCEYERHGCHAHVDEAFDFDAAVAADMMREADEMGLMEWVVVDEQAFDEHCERMEHSLAACMP